MKAKNLLKTGGCNCGAVRYEIGGPLRDIVACYCSTCRRQHGSFGMYSKVYKDNLEVTRDSGLSWYSSSLAARRGFCQICGSGLFWERHDTDSICVTAGSLDDLSGLATIGHVFVAEKPDCYLLCDKLPQFQHSSNGQL